MLTPRPTDPNAAAHERLYRTLRQQVMHGELDPGDILLNQKAEPKIGNFGFTHPLEDSAADSPFSAPELRAGSPASA